MNSNIKKNMHEAFSARFNMLGFSARSFRLYNFSLRNIIWYLVPIKKEELLEFLLMAFMMFCILFNFGSLRSLKDSIIIPLLGAEVISFLKFWLVLPSAVIFTFAYTFLSNVLKMEYIYYIIVSVFLIMFNVFSFVVYPAQDLYKIDADVVTYLVAYYPNLKWFIKIAGSWGLAIMYLLCELWGVVVINLMFWQFVNQITTSDKAKRVYPALGLIGNLGLFAAGSAIVACSSVEYLPDYMLSKLQCSPKDLDEITLKLLIIAVTISGMLSMVLYFTLNRLFSEKAQVKALSQKTKLSFKESINLVLNSKYLGLILGLVICYGLIINVLEGPWKAKIKELYPTTREYMNFMGQINIWLGVSCVVFMIIGSSVMRIYNWLFASLMTPIIIVITGSLFFIFVIFQDYISFIKDPLYIAVIFGAAQNILSKACKYSVFDPTKEMTYIPLETELKSKGKAAVEVVGAKFGKSLGAFIQSMMFSFIPSADFTTIMPVLMVVFLVVSIIWIIDVKELNKEYLRIAND